MREAAPRQRIVLLPNGTDCAPLIKLERAAPDPQAPLRLLYIGRLVRTKGLFEILEALKLLRRSGVATRLVIAGSGPVEEALHQSARALGLEDIATFAGPAFGERKVQLLAEAEVLLLPTYHLEGLPYALLEGMAAGLVPIVTRVGAIPDVVRQGVHGVFVAPRDPEALARAIQSLAADRALLERLGAASRQRVATSYSVERLAGDFTVLYRALAGPAASLAA
jgi:glycosyltransferase involved in cell wall biosynthesis